MKGQSPLVIVTFKIQLFSGGALWSSLYQLTCITFNKLVRRMGLINNFIERYYNHEKWEAETQHGRSALIRNVFIYLKVTH